ncbi:MAG TPA: hypothetical protein VGM88_07600 [Kofleriaceae bacterium]|jgi:hypothetical protein
MRRTLLALAAILPLAACTKRKEHKEAPAPAVAKTVAPAQPDRDEVALVSPGSEPRAPLRYHFAAGAKSQLDITMDLAMKSADLPAAALGTLPSPRFRLAMEITDVAADGTATLRSTILGVGAIDQPGEKVKAAAMQDKLALMTGLAFVAKVSPSGVVTDSTVAPGAKVPPELAPQLEQLHNVLQQVVLALPVEPIGKDGQWKVTKRVAQQGLAMTVVTTFKLTDVKADAFSFAGTTEQHAVPAAGTASGPHVIGLDGHGDATGTVELGAPAMSYELKSQITTTVGADDKPQHMSLDLGVHVVALPPGSDQPITAGSAQGAQSAP